MLSNLFPQIFSDNNFEKRRALILADFSNIHTQSPQKLMYAKVQSFFIHVFSKYTDNLKHVVNRRELTFSHD